MTSSDVPPAERTGLATTSHDEEFRTDPHPIYDRLRDADAALVADADHGRFVATRHHVVRSLLRDQRFGVDARRARSDAYVRRIAATGVELLRFDCPITETARVANEETSVEGCPVAPGDVVTLSLSAANHDPARFAEPHTLDLERDADGHLAFGSGLHVCLGAPLARMEAQLAIGGFVQRFPHARLVDASPPRRHLPFFRGLESLRVRLG